MKIFWKTKSKKIEKDIGSVICRFERAAFNLKNMKILRRATKDRRKIEER